jgi:hypothetical protein
MVVMVAPLACGCKSRGLPGCLKKKWRGWCWKAATPPFSCSQLWVAAVRMRGWWCRRWGLGTVHGHAAIRRWIASNGPLTSACVKRGSGVPRRWWRTCLGPPSERARGCLRRYVGVDAVDAARLSRTFAGLGTPRMPSRAFFQGGLSWLRFASTGVRGARELAPSVLAAGVDAACPQGASSGAACHGCALPPQACAGRACLYLLSWPRVSTLRHRGL